MEAPSRYDANPFAAPGQWYKGNLHAHSTGSDGKLDPPVLVDHYRRAGYDFLALTDHDQVTPTDGLGDDGFLLLSGTEISARREELPMAAHVVAFGLAAPGTPPKGGPVPEAIAWAKQHGGEALIAHPYLCSMDVRELISWPDYLGIEVVNTSCQFEVGRGYSSVHWDGLLARGRRVWGFATDDSHHNCFAEQPVDTASAWVMVKAPALTREALLDSLRAGLFYSSWGPELHDITRHDGLVTARTSPVKVINFITDTWWGRGVFALDGGTRTEASYQLDGRERFLRVECQDAEGRFAWSNPLFVKDAPDPGA